MGRVDTAAELGNARAIAGAEDAHQCPRLAGRRQDLPVRTQTHGA